MLDIKVHGSKIRKRLGCLNGLPGESLLSLKIKKRQDGFTYKVASEQVLLEQCPLDLSGDVWSEYTVPHCQAQLSSTVVEG